MGGYLLMDWLIGYMMKRLIIFKKLGIILAGTVYKLQCEFKTNLGLVVDLISWLIDWSQGGILRAAGSPRDPHPDPEGL